MRINSILSAIVNVVLLAGLPFSIYVVWQRWRRRRDLAEITRRVGLRLETARYLGACLLAAGVVVLAIVVWPPPLEPMTRPGSAQHEFTGLGLELAVPMALLYGIVKTGFAEELLFRGMIAGSLARRLAPAWANFWQALIFLLPHLLLLLVAPEVWTLLPIIFLGALFSGWIRIKSGSIVGPWVLHASVNVAMCLSVAVRSSA